MPEIVSLDELLNGSSRTFAISIPLLPEPLRTEISVAYLLFRLADTLEDEGSISNEERAARLQLLRNALEDIQLTKGKSGWLPELSEPPEHAGYMRLFEEATFLADSFFSLEHAVKKTIASHLIRTIDGMILFVQRGRETHDLEETLGYCYSVAGIVGELCTALFLRHDSGLREAAAKLRSLAPKFGEGLQLVNMLRDASADGEANRSFQPRGVTSEVLLKIAREDLAHADQYVEVLHSNGASPGVVAFNTLNTRLAHETLRLIERDGPGVRLSRNDVARIVLEVHSLCGVGD